MDSFYDAPRRPPQPIPRETFPATPLVPEISVLCPSNTPRNPFTPYNQWKKENMPNHFLVTNKENINNQFSGLQNNSILKKQVRFESPVLQQKLTGSADLFLNKTQQNPGNQTKNDSNHKPNAQARAVPNFEQMYMANIPNRQLDLSVIDVPKRISPKETKNKCLEGNLLSKETEPVEKEQPKTYKEFLDRQKKENKVILNDSVTDIFNYKRNTNSSPKVINNVQRVGVSENTKTFNNRHSPGNVSYKQTLKDLRYDQKDSYGKMESERHFQHVTEVISQRNVPVPFENPYTHVEQRWDLNNDMHQKPWCVVQNNDCESIQNRVLFKGNGNLSKNNPQENGNNPKNNIFKKSHSEETQNKQCIENFEAEYGIENSDGSRKHVDSESQTLPLVINHNLDTPNLYQTTCQPSGSQAIQLDSFENNALKVRSDDDFSVKDLLKIIAQQSQQISQQNEQLLLLQKQVSTLISQANENRCPRQKSIRYGQERNGCQQENGCYDRPRHCCSQDQHCEQKRACIQGSTNENGENVQDRCITSTQHEQCDGLRKKLQATTKKNKNNMQNFSIGLTTSFEVSFRQPHKNQNDFLQKNKQLQDFNQYEPLKIQEITETESAQSQENCHQSFLEVENDNRETLVDESMIFREPIRVREACPSPEPSIKINMNDYEDSEEEDVTTPEIGPSFYKNLMVQVNKILQKAQIETTEAYDFKGQNLKQNTLHKVKEATLKHLRRIGVEVQNADDSSQSSSSSDDMNSKSYNQEDISFAVKQLLMKYLPADHLAKVAYQEAQPLNHAGLTPKEKIGAIRNRPDFSFATVQYMKKYNLISNNQKGFCLAVKQNQPESPKILDITKLKQQPKLL